MDNINFYKEHFSDICCYEDYLMRVDLMGKKHNDKQVLDSLPKCDNHRYIVANGEVIWINDNGELVDTPNITSISDCAFAYWGGIHRIVIPNGVKKIESRAFYYCTDLKSVTIPVGVTEIGWHAFDGCSQLISVTMPDSVDSIRDGAFYNCRRLTSVTISEGVQSIGDRAFFECGNLKVARIPYNCVICSFVFPKGCEVIRY